MLSYPELPAHKMWLAALRVLSLMSQHMFVFNFRSILCFKLRKIVDDLALINNKPCSGSGDIEETNEPPLELLLAANGKRSHPLAFWVNIWQIVKKIAAPPASN